MSERFYMGMLPQGIDPPWYWDLLRAYPTWRFHVTTVFFGPLFPQIADEARKIANGWRNFARPDELPLRLTLEFTGVEQLGGSTVAMIGSGADRPLLNSLRHGIVHARELESCVNQEFPAFKPHMSFPPDDKKTGYIEVAAADIADGANIMTFTGPYLISNRQGVIR